MTATDERDTQSPPLGIAKSDVDGANPEHVVRCMEQLEPIDPDEHTRSWFMRHELANAYRFAKARGHPAAFLCLSENEPLGTGSVREIGTSVVNYLTCCGADSIDELDLVIDSVGGDVHAAYRLVSFLCDKTVKFNACVPSYARSAATLLCVAADRIVLDDLAVLGPLDAQVYEPGRGYRPALNTFKSLERIAGFSLETLRAANVAMEELNITGEQAIKYALQLVRILSESMFTQMEPTKIGEFSQALAVGERYGDRLYDRRTRPDMTLDEWRKVISQLVNGYAHHEVAIDFNELKRLRLPVFPFGAPEKPFVPSLAERHGMERMVFFLDPSTVTDLDKWLAEGEGSRLMRRETKRRAENGDHRGPARQSVYDIRAIPPRFRS